MGFYGNIKNTSRSDFYFDKIYPSRAVMDNSVNSDGIYAGRFVLVEYEQDFSADQFLTGIYKQGILYAHMPSGQKPIVYSTEAAVSNEYIAQIVEPGTIIHIPLENNFDAIDINGDPITTSCFYKIENSNDIKSSVPKYDYDAEQHTLTEVDGQYISQISYAQHTLIKPDQTLDLEHDSFFANFWLDKVIYGVARGYDSTVWQKTYIEGNAKYVMIAELNSVVPTFDVTAEAPTTMPIKPHFDINSTNVYYKLHIQPQWGFRVKAQNPLLELPKLDDNGYPLITTNGEQQLQLAAEDIRSELYNTDVIPENYPSDEKTCWAHTTYDKISGLQETTYFNPTLSMWDTDQAELPAAIYFNKKGFLPDIITYSDANLEDHIRVTPTGYSGYQYYDHNPENTSHCHIDTQELSIMLPSIGNTIAKVWDLIYGGKKLYGYTDDTKVMARNLDLKWQDANMVHSRSGLRILKNTATGSYKYWPEAGGTVAGVLNSAQDLMGMIFTANKPEDPAEANSNYIYYDNIQQQFYIKRRTWTYTALEDLAENRVLTADQQLAYTPIIGLKDWDTSAFYIDNNDFKLAQEFEAEQRYIRLRDDEIDPQSTDPTPHLSYVHSAFQPISLDVDVFGADDTSYFVKKTYTYPDRVTADQYELTDIYDRSYEYYELNERNLESTYNVYQIYTPNTYYYTEFVRIPSIRDINYEPNIYYIETEPRPDSTEIATFDLATYETVDEVIAFLDENPTKHLCKKIYILDTSLMPDNARTYYMLKTQKTLQVSYYIKVAEAELIHLTASDYNNASNDAQYYYKKDPAIALTENDTTITIGSQIYILDKSGVWQENREYYLITYSYELRSKDDIVEVKDEDVQKIDTMFTFNDSRLTNQSIDIFYKYVADNGHSGYIKVSASNYQRAYNSATQVYDFLLCEYQRKIFGEPYQANTYYYITTSLQEDNVDEDLDYSDVNTDLDYFVGSYILDTSDFMTPNRQYYILSAANKRELLEHATHLVDEYYVPGKYYVRNGSGYNLANGTFSSNTQYYQPLNQLYVIEDTRNRYAKGAEWPMNILKIPAEVTVGTRQEAWEYVALPSINYQINTLYGLLLRLNRHLDTTDNLTRDPTTVQGNLNRIDDFFARFSTLNAGQVMMIDEYGSILSVKPSTKQQISFIDSMTDGAKIAPDGMNLDRENSLVTLSIIDQYGPNGIVPSITIQHTNANKVEDEEDHVIDLNSSGEDTIQLYSPFIDNAGHIVGKKITTVTLPYGFKTIKVTNTATDVVADAADTIVADGQIADNTQDILTFAASNKWIKLDNNTDDTIKIGHTVSTIATSTSNFSLSDEGNGKTFAVPTYTYDLAGHITALATTTYTMPNGYGKFTDGTTTSSAAATCDTFTVNGDDWLQAAVTTDNITYSHKAANTVTAANVANVTPAFGATFTITDLVFDEKGHIYAAGNGSHTVTIPQGSLNETINSNQNKVLNGIQFVPTTGAITVEANHLGNLQIGTYYTTTPENIITSINATTPFKDIIYYLDTTLQTTITDLNTITTKDLFSSYYIIDPETSQLTNTLKERTETHERIQTLEDALYEIEDLKQRLMALESQT